MQQQISRYMDRKIEGQSILLRKPGHRKQLSEGVLPKYIIKSSFENYFFETKEVTDLKLAFKRPFKQYNRKDRPSKTTKNTVIRMVLAG